MARRTPSALVVALGRRFMQQFSRPRGVLGALAGRMMASRNGPANRLLASHLGIEPGMRALDVGCGPGLGVEALHALATPGEVAGVDVSPVMVRQARSRMRAAVRAGDVRIELGSADHLPFPSGRFDRVASVNSLAFWPDLGAALAEIRRVLAPGGRAGFLLRMRDEGAGPLDRRSCGMTEARLDEVVRALADAGFAHVRSLRAEVAGERVAMLLAARDEVQA